MIDAGKRPEIWRDKAGYISAKLDPAAFGMGWHGLVLENGRRA